MPNKPSDNEINKYSPPVPILNFTRTNRVSVKILFRVYGNRTRKSRVPVYHSRGRCTKILIFHFSNVYQFFLFHFFELSTIRYQVPNTCKIVLDGNLQLRVPPIRDFYIKILTIFITFHSLDNRTSYKNKIGIASIDEIHNTTHI